MRTIAAACAVQITMRSSVTGTGGSIDPRIQRRMEGVGPVVGCEIQVMGRNRESDLHPIAGYLYNFGLRFEPDSNVHKYYLCNHLNGSFESIVTKATSDDIRLLLPSVKLDRKHTPRTLGIPSGALDKDDAGDETEREDPTSRLWRGLSWGLTWNFWVKDSDVRQDLWLCCLYRYFVKPMLQGKLSAIRAAVKYLDAARKQGENSYIGNAEDI
ncbi:hypothetical protein BJ138DRAFT_1102915 [Hygrophoropsis aurantiaca]|uniref:Uncharacterized protein n=1 Tax=Hygrophoropsis aurantiaca TaxID=72124 RepID=A0ACB8A7H3_9AGAM|nr:hypothetical protein BJ138DRAFT_1102915 [Hygrophoropsis aurantiaca]